MKQIQTALFLISALIVGTSQNSRNLNDANFEHDTQATTGSTTGDWFLLFCDPANELNCSKEGVFEQWDELYSRLFGRATAAYINTK